MNTHVSNKFIFNMQTNCQFYFLFIIVINNMLKYVKSFFISENRCKASLSCCHTAIVSYTPQSIKHPNLLNREGILLNIPFY